MGRLFNNIRNAVEGDRYVIGIHANQRLRERSIPAWQIIGGLSSGRLLLERPHDEPNPVVEVEQLLADGSKVKAVWSWLEADQAAKLVTVHFIR